MTFEWNKWDLLSVNNDFDELNWWWEKNATIQAYDSYDIFNIEFRRPCCIAWATIIYPHYSLECLSNIEIMEIEPV